MSDLLNAMRNAAEAKAAALRAALAEEDARIARMKADGEKLADNHWQKQHALRLRVRVAAGLVDALSEPGP